MSKGDPLRAWLDDLCGTDDPDAIRQLVIDHGAGFLGIPGIASTLVSRRETDADLRLILFEILVGEARMDMENRGRLGQSFLAEARVAIDALSEADGLDLGTAMSLARAYARAEMEAPESLVSFLLGDVEAQAGMEGVLDDLDAQLDDLRGEVGDDDYMLHAFLNDMLCVVPAPLRPGVVHHVACRDEAWCGRLALYWLLDAATEVRQAAAGGLGERARQGCLDAPTASPLPLIRTWMPEDGARLVLDEALREARQLELVGPLEPPVLRPARLLGTLPDGSGGQNFAVALEGEGVPVAALVLLKSGKGVKDAFLVRGDGAEDAVSMQADDADGLDLAREALEPALAAALAEGLSAGRPAPAGLIDVAEACGFGALRPQRMTARDWLAYLDPEGEIAGLSAHERGRLIGRSARWLLDHPVVETWFEGTAVVDAALEGASSPRQLDAALWAALEKRRGYWALLMLRAAHVLKAATGNGDWRSFAATVSALLDGRALKKVPIMGHMLGASIAAWQAEEAGLDAGDQDKDDRPYDA